MYPLWFVSLDINDSTIIIEYIVKSLMFFETGLTTLIEYAGKTGAMQKKIRHDTHCSSRAKHPIPDLLPSLKQRELPAHT